jgi:hypothetical protein
MSRCQISVYPDPDAVDSLGGHHSPLLSRAIESLSALHSFASANLETLLDRDDWNFLAEALKDTSLEPSSADLCQRLAVAVENAAQRDSLAFAVYADSSGKRPQKLAATVRSLDRSHAGFIVWSVQWLWLYAREVDPALCQWWQPTYRATHARRDIHNRVLDLTDPAKFSVLIRRQT